MDEHTNAAFGAALLKWIEVAALGIELLAVAIIVVVTLTGTGIFLRRFFARDRPLDAYEGYKVQLGRGLLLGLEILVAADIVRTVALEPSVTNVAILGILVLIRTFLSWSLVVEIEHRWPWQVPAHHAPAAEPAPPPAARPAHAGD